MILAGKYTGRQDIPGRSAGFSGKWYTCACEVIHPETALIPPRLSGRATTGTFRAGALSSLPDRTVYFFVYPGQVITTGYLPRPIKHNF